MKKDNKWVKRGCLGSGCLLLAALLVLSPLMRSGDASAIDSLPYVEKIKATQSTYTILEITPSAPSAGTLTGYGSIGYYVKGSEPCKDWQSRLSAIQTAAARDAAAEALFTSLAGAGILGTGEDTPLKASFYTGTDGYYLEKYPWALADLTGWTALTLGREEIVHDYGTFAPRGSASTGPFFSKVYDYTLLDTPTGDSVQNIVYLTYFTASPTAAADYYYYTPAAEAWRAIEWNDDGSLKTTGLDPSAAVYIEHDGYYEKVGILGQTILSHDQTYYYLDLTKLGQPSATWSAGCYAAAKSAGFRPAADSERDYAYFKSNGGTSYRLSDSGEYVFTAGGSQSATIYTSKVWFKGGYTNSQWFLSKVFDVSTPSGSAIGVKVNSYAADRVTPAMVSAADMVVLSAGFDPARSASSYLPAAGGDFVSGSTAAQQIQALAAAGNTPIVVDWRLTQGSASPNMRALAEACLSGSPADADHHFVSGSIYCFTPTGAVQALVTGRFAAAFTSAATTDGFSDALDEILNENFLRKRSGLSDSALLDQHISMAAAMRYIINHRGARVTGEIRSVRVLELEPATAKSAITEAQVYDWLGKPETLKDYATRADAIVITTMATAEFVGRIEDLVESYDLIYIGDSAEGLKTNAYTGETVYNDSSNMNGLLYSNIGDTYTASYQLTGLLDRDYSSSTSNGYRRIDASSGSSARTFRFSGNDLTESKAQELREFAEGGYPIVLGDKLMGYGTKNTTINFSVVVAGSGNASTATLTASIPEDLPDGQSITYDWYYVNARNGYTYKYGSSATTTSVSHAITVDSDYIGDQFYCVATIGGGSATSNRVSISRSATNLTVNESYAAKQDVTVIGGGGSTTYTAVAEYSKGASSVTLYAALTPTLSAGTSIESWQWQKWNGNTWNNLFGGNESSISVGYTYDDYYRCKMTLSNGRVVTTNYVNIYYYYYATSGGDSDSITISNPTSSYVLSVDAYAGTPSGDSVTLSSHVTPATVSVSYQWQRSRNGSTSFENINNSSSCTVTQYNNGTYYYRLRVRIKIGDTNYNAYSNVIQVTRSSGTLSVSPVSGYPGTSGSFVGTEIDPSTLSVNTLRLDRASNLYAALSAVVGKPNVMPKLKVTPGKADYAVNSGTLYQYLNLSKPKLDWVATEDPNCRNGYPTAYSLTDTGAITSLAPLADGSYSLTYSFQITNATDPTPQTTTYDCRFYIDLNSDGLYKTDEQLGSVEIALASSGKVIQPSNGVYALKADTVYRLTRPLPQDKVGIIAWKLEVAQNGESAYSHASQHGYTRVAAATKTPIRILQIMYNDGGGMNLSTNSTYQRYLPQVPDFAITINTVYANRLDDSRYWVVNGMRYSTRAEYFAQYDMLILGFADAYREISDAAANDILSYSKSHAVLFTHDTTSICNLPVNYYPMTSGSVAQPDTYFWGYSFNTILRSAVGLDRYGVTDATWGRTRMSQRYAAASGGPVSSGPVSLTAKDGTGALISQQIKDAGYTIAYRPKAAAASGLSGYQWATVAETQGYTSHTLHRYAENNSVSPVVSGNRDTKYISQTNEGQITTYPFNLNSVDFGGTATSNLLVAPTHEQYYQLNMNADDIVVWYCLSNSQSAAITDAGYYASAANDVVNSYYIYTKGNITYSGAGHSGSTVTDDEAKLFINTMVAAFRSVAQKPTIRITDSADSNSELQYKYFALDYQDSGDGLTAGKLGGDIDEMDRTIYFRIIDPSLSAVTGAKTLVYQYALLDKSGNPGARIDLTPSSVVRIDYTPGATSGSLVLKPLTDGGSDPLSLLNGDVAAVRLYIRIDGQGDLSSEAYVDLRKIGLFELN